MLINGISWQGLHSQLDFGATTTERQLQMPEKDRITDRVPYSSITYDFTSLYGTASYAERTLQYKFMISDEKDIRYLKERVEQFKRWLYEPVKKSALYDDTEKEYHFNAVCTSVSEKYTNGVIAEISATFMADPFKIPNATSELLAIPISDCRYPDLDGDGSVTATDATLILTASANIGSGLESGLTAEQALLADVDRDGKITARDAELVQTFSALCGAGFYTDDKDGWTKFLNYQLDRMAEVL
ncbi:MAG: hypothetical protein K2K06_01610 [Oscillospiraceae bacterium]|nr:hypothetical protein [Oscillospiraceae bacterium]